MMKKKIQNSTKTRSLIHDSNCILLVTTYLAGYMLDYEIEKEHCLNN